MWPVSCVDCRWHALVAVYSVWRCNYVEDVLLEASGDGKLTDKTQVQW